MLDRLLLGSEEYAKELGESLKSRVFTEVFPVLAEGFVASMRQRGATDLDDDALGIVFQGTLTLLYRLLFLLYAESRDLLPVHAREYREPSLQHLKTEIQEAAGTIADETEKQISKHYEAHSYGLWQRLRTLFHVVDRGSEELNVPRYNGGLFLAERDKDDHSPEADAARFLERERINDRFFARAIDLLARVIDPKRHDLVFVDYKSLGVRQLGSIYEGLLEFHLRIAGEKLAVVKVKGREVYSPFKELSERELERLWFAISADRFQVGAVLRAVFPFVLGLDRKRQIAVPLIWLSTNAVKSTGTSSPSTVRQYGNPPGRRTRTQPGRRKRSIAPGLQRSAASETLRLNNLTVPLHDWCGVRSARSGMTAMIRQRRATGGCFAAMLAAYRGNASPKSYPH
jgi:hypothetical protein